MNPFKRGFVLCVVLLLTAAMPLVAQEKKLKPDPMVLGKVAPLESKELGETRKLFIALPRSYFMSKQSYPVLYLLDGEAHFRYAVGMVEFLAAQQRIPEMIVVGIPNTNRLRDFSPVQVSQYPGSGGADKFRAFMKKELKPYIEKNFRTAQYTVLFGHSMCGMYAVYDLAKGPDYYGAYIAVSPYLVFADHHVLELADEALSKKTGLATTFYVSYGNEPQLEPDIQALDQMMQAAKCKQLAFRFEKMQTENHGSVTLKSLYNGLEYIFADFPLPSGIVDKGVEAIKAHYKAISDKYKYEARVPEYTLNLMGYQLIGQNKLKEAIALFEYNVELYPKSANVYDSLGEAYQANKQYQFAKKNFEMAVKLGEKNKDPNLPIYKTHLQNMLKQMGIEPKSE